MFFLIREPFPHVGKEAGVNDGPGVCVLGILSEATYGVDSLRKRQVAIYLAWCNLDNLPG